MVTNFVLDATTKRALVSFDATDVVDKLLVNSFSLELSLNGCERPLPAAKPIISSRMQLNEQRPIAVPRASVTQHKLSRGSSQSLSTTIALIN